MRALLSVSDKAGLIPLAEGLAAIGVELISTGGTQKAIEAAGIPVKNISEVTGFPECLDGRVKTLHPAIHAGILAIRGNAAHEAQLAELALSTIDLVVVNLYPFKETILKEGTKLEEAIENIDIGGPTMLRAAAKNYTGVTVITDPGDYAPVLAALQQDGSVSEALRFTLAAKVFAHTAHYDSLIARYLQEKAGLPQFPETLSLTFEKVQDLRYGENPHQNAAFYREVGKHTAALTDAVQLHGKQLSFNNIHDTHGALELLKEFDEPTIIACKHANPCGAGSGETILEACHLALSSDPVSVFGGILVANREIDAETAAEIAKIFVEIVLAPSFSEEALAILQQKKNLRLLTLAGLGTKEAQPSLDLKKVSGGLLVQEADTKLLEEGGWKVATDRAPTPKEEADLLFAWRLVKYTKSNGIAIAKNRQSIGIGPGQVSRIWACEQAIDHGQTILGKEAVSGASLASDAFFPFPDCVAACAEAGITAIIQPGGSVRDQESIDLCNQHGIAMVFTGMRHFRH